MMNHQNSQDAEEAAQDRGRPLPLYDGGEGSYRTGYGTGPLRQRLGVDSLEAPPRNRAANAKAKSLIAYDADGHTRYYVMPDASPPKKYSRRIDFDFVCDRCDRPTLKVNEQGLCGGCVSLELRYGPDPTPDEIWNVLTKQIQAGWSSLEERRRRSGLYAADESGIVINTPVRLGTFAEM